MVISDNGRSNDVRDLLSFSSKNLAQKIASRRSVVFVKLDIYVYLYDRRDARFQFHLLRPYDSAVISLPGKASMVTTAILISGWYPEVYFFQFN